MGPLSNNISFIQGAKRWAEKTHSITSKEPLKVIRSHITEIPQDLLVLIFSELSREDLLAVHKTCKTFSTIHLNPRILSNLIGKPLNGFHVKELLFISKIPDFRARALNFDTISNETRNNDEIGQVLEAFPAVEELTLVALHDNQFYNIEKIAKLQKLKHLQLYIKRQLKMPIFENLKNLNSLILHNQIDSAIGKILNSCKELHFLSLYSCSIGFKTGKKLSELNQLTTLNLNRCRRYLIIGEWLKSCQSLQHLKISYADIDCHVIEKIQSLKNLRTLYLKGCDNITYQDLESLSVLSRLKVIYIRNCQKISPNEQRKMCLADLRIEDWNYERKNEGIRQKLAQLSR